MAAAQFRSVGTVKVRTALRLTLVVVAVAATTLPPVSSSADSSTAGSLGTDTRLPATDSQVTVSGRGEFAGLSVTVNQTANLNNQAVSVSWTGGEATIQSPGRFSGNFMQLMQCWGDDDGTVPSNPGPPPEQCVQGAVSGVYGGSGAPSLPGGLATTRVISRIDWPNFDAATGVADPTTTNVWRPFRSVTGDEVGIHTDSSFNPVAGGGSFWLNSFFNIITTNEIPASPTGEDGSGADLFEVQTGVQASGLGCGQRVEELPDGSKRVPKCWLVVVPRGTPAQENLGTPFSENAEQFGVMTSPLSPAAWANRIAIPLTFNPVDSPCVIGADERRLVGSELVLPAISSWQPKLCLQGGLPPYSFAPVSDSLARQQLLSGAFGAPGMVAVSRPIDSASLTPANPVVYSPLSVSGLVIGFNIERNPKPTAAADHQSLAGVRVANINLTPRLVAKLLTQSYRGAVNIISTPGYPWLAGNPNHLGTDPDFLRFNAEFSELSISDARTFSGLQLPAGNSDAALQVWEWVMGDAEAAAWLAGAPDEWGMRVNPAYATTSSLNSLGLSFGSPLPTSFPKADPYCYQGPNQGSGNSIVPPLLCGTDWMPYARGFGETARVARVAFDGAKVALNPFALSASAVWKTDLPQYIGRRSMLSLTDAPSAALFGLQVASLSRAGDNGSGRRFIEPTVSALNAGVAAMQAKSETTVLEPKPSAVAPEAYPLTTITYAAVAPLSLSSEARSDYADFLEFAVGEGQQVGAEVGNLPRGYAPLSANLKSVAATAIGKIRTLTPTPSTTTTTSPPNTTPSYTYPDYTYPVEPPPVTESSVPVETATSTVSTSTTTTTTSVESGGPTTTVVQPAVVTPRSQTGRMRYAVAGLGAMAVGSALLALEITKRPRRRSLTAISVEAGS